MFNEHLGCSFSEVEFVKYCLELQAKTFTVLRLDINLLTSLTSRMRLVSANSTLCTAE